MNEPERETAGTVRSTAVAHFIAPGWPQTCAALAGALERTVPATLATQLLVIVPDAASATALAREIRLHVATRELRVLPARDVTRAARVQREAPAHIVLGSPAVLAGMLGASALPLQELHTVVLAAADEYAGDLDTLSTILSEVPRAASRILLAADTSPAIETLLERHLHRARRTTPGVELADPALPSTPAIQVRIVAPLAPFEPVGDLLDELDPPSAAIVAGDTHAEAQLKELLLSLGYPAVSPLVRVTRGEIADHTHLVVFAGVPVREVLVAALAAHPARVVALVSVRERVALQRVAHDSRLVPFEPARSASDARGRENAARETIRHALAESLPSREMLALEPLLAEHDALAIAGATLRMYERAEAAARVAKQAGRDELRAEQRNAAPKPEAGAGPRPFSGPRSGSGARPGSGSRHDAGPGRRPSGPDDRKGIPRRPR